MAESRQKSAWEHTAWLLHMANVAAGYPFSRMKKASDWNPFSTKDNPSKKPETMGSLKGFKHYFVKA